jgi:hypothetical protein
LFLLGAFFAGAGRWVSKPRPTEDDRWPKLKVGEIKQALFKQASYKAPGPEGIKKIAIKKVWKDSGLKSVATTFFSECIRIEYHSKVKRSNCDIEKAPNKPENIARSYSPITLLNCLDKILEKVVQKRLASLTTDTILKHQFGGRNGFFLQLMQSQSWLTTLKKISNGTESHLFSPLTSRVLLIMCIMAFS